MVREPAGLFDRGDAPEPFVRAALRFVEDELRRLALHGLADWERLEIASPALFGALASLQRPSFGSWNGLLQALRAARRDAGREGRAVKTPTLDSIVRALDVSLAPQDVSPLEDVAKLARVSFRRPTRARLYELAIALRNRVAHEDPTANEWWSEAQAGLGALVDYLQAHVIELPAELPAPWFRETDGAAFAGMTQTFEVIYAGDARPDASQAGPVLLAIQRLLGKAETKDVDLKKLLARLAPEDAKGVVLGDFLVGAPVASGGFATVHVARQLSTGRKVAIKILHDGLEEDASLRFQREAAYLSQFSQPSIVTVLGYGEDVWTAPRAMAANDEEWFLKFKRSAAVKSYIALEWIDGRTLDHVFANEKPAVAQIIGWFRQAAEALANVHALGLIHRDLKPSNLMVTHDDRVVVMDFGIARAHSDDRTQLTMTGSTVGTPAYMAPEQLIARDAETDVGPAADLYALCATFYELLTKERLYGHGHDSDDAVTRRKMTGAAPPRPRSLDRQVPWQLETLVLGGLQREARDRPASMRALADDLHAVEEDRPITYRRPSLARRAQLAYRRNTRAVWVSLAFIAFATTAVAVYLINVREEQRHTTAARRESDQRLTTLLAEQGRQRLLEGNRVDALLFLLEAYKRDPHAGVEITTGLADAMQIVDAQVGLIHTGHRLGSAALTASGRRIAVAGEKGIEVWDLVTRRQTFSVDIGKAAAEVLRFTAQDQLVALLDDHRALVLDPDGKSIRELTGVIHDEATGEADPESLRADARALVLQPEDDEAITVVDPVTGDVLSSVADAGQVSAAAFGPAQRLALVGSGVVHNFSTSTATLWDLSKRRRITTLVDESEWSDPTGIVFDGSTGPMVLKSGGEVFVSVHFGPRGQLITVEGQRQIKHWDGATGKLMGKEDRDYPTMPWIARFKGDYAVLGSSDLVHVTGGRDDFVVRAHGSIAAVALSDKRVAVAHSSGKVTLHDLWSGVEQFTYQAAAAPIEDVLFSPDGTQLIAVDESGDIRIWSVRTSHLERELRDEHLGEIYGATVVDDRWLVTSHHHEFAVWDLQHGGAPRIIEGTQYLQRVDVVDVGSGMAMVRDPFSGDYVVLIDAASARRVLELKLPDYGFTLSDGKLVIHVGQTTIGAWDMTGAQRWTQPLAKRLEDVYVERTVALDAQGVRDFDGTQLQRWTFAGTPEPPHPIQGEYVAVDDQVRHVIVRRGNATFVIDLTTFAERPLPIGTGEISLASDGRTAFVHRSSGVVEAWDLVGCSRRLTLAGRFTTGRFQVLDEDRIVSHVAVGETSEHATIWSTTLWSNKDGAALAPVPFDHGTPYAHATKFVTTDDSTIRLWDMSHETRPPALLESLVREWIPWELHDGRVSATE